MLSIWFIWGVDCNIHTEPTVGFTGLNMFLSVTLYTFNDTRHLAAEDNIFTNGVQMDLCGNISFIYWVPYSMQVVVPFSYLLSQTARFFKIQAQLFQSLCGRNVHRSCRAAYHPCLWRGWGWRVCWHVHPVLLINWNNLQEYYVVSIAPCRWNESCMRNENTWKTNPIRSYQTEHEVINFLVLRFARV